MSQPIKLKDEASYVFYELHAGKMAAQTGSTCFHDAMERILSQSQKDSAHWKECCERKRLILEEEQKLLSRATPYTDKEFTLARRLGNKTFLEKKGQGFEATALDFFKTSIKEGAPHASSEAEWDSAVAGAKKSNPLLVDQQANKAADYLMATGSGLEKVLYSELSTIQKVIHTLRVKGPFLIGNRLSRSIYLEAAIRVGEIGKHVLYGWRKGAAQLDLQGYSIGHAIVVVGARVEGDKEHIYWIDPNDPYDLDDPKSRTYATSFKTFDGQMRTIRGGVPFSIQRAQGKVVESMAVAFFNPEFSSK